MRKGQETESHQRTLDIPNREKTCRGDQKMLAYVTIRSKSFFALEYFLLERETIVAVRCSYFTISERLSISHTYAFRGYWLLIPYNCPLWSFDSADNRPPTFRSSHVLLCCRSLEISRSKALVS